MYMEHIVLYHLETPFLPNLTYNVGHPRFWDKMKKNQETLQKPDIIGRLKENAMTISHIFTLMNPSEVCYYFLKYVTLIIGKTVLCESIWGNYGVFV